MTIVGDLNELGSTHVDTTHDKMSANVTTVLEDVVRDATSSHLDSVFTVSVESVQLELALNHLYRKSKTLVKTTSRKL